MDKEIQELTNWLKNLKSKYRIGIIVGIFVITIVIPFVINLLFKMVSVGCLKAEWGPGEALNFYGTLLSFIGSVILGCVAFYLSKKSNDISDRLLELEKSRDENEIKPFVVINDFKAILSYVSEVEENAEPGKINVYIGEAEIIGDNKEQKTCLCISMFFINTSFSFTTLEFDGAEVYENDKCLGHWKQVYSNTKSTKLYLKCGDIGEIVFYASKETMQYYSSNKIEMRLRLQNRLGYDYIEILEICPMILHEKEGDEWYIHLNTQKFDVKKSENDSKSISQD